MRRGGRERREGEGEREREGGIEMNTALNETIRELEGRRHNYTYIQCGRMEEADVGG